MKFRGRVAAAAAVLCLFPSVAGAADFTPPTSEIDSTPAPTTASGQFFVSLYGGLVFPQDPTATFELLGAHPSGTINTDTGYRAGGSFGYDFNPNLSADVEVSYANSAISSIDVGAPFNKNVPTSGHGSLLTVMGNLTVGEHFGRWRPYVGAGAGAALVSLDASFASGLHDSDWTWGAQAFAGIDFAVTKDMSLGARYRYQYIGATDYHDGNGYPVNLDGFGIHSIEAVLKVAFQ